MANEFVVPEFIQDNLDPNAVAHEALALLANPQRPKAPLIVFESTDIAGTK